MSSNIHMPAFGSDPNAQAMVKRVLRRPGFAVDVGEPLIEVSVGRYHTLTVATHRDGGIYEMRAWMGQTVKAGNLIAVIGEGSQTFRNAVFIAYRRSDSSGYTGRIYDGIARDLGSLQVFRDLGSLRPGRDFVQQVNSALRQRAQWLWLSRRVG